MHEPVVSHPLPKVIRGRCAMKCPACRMGFGHVFIKILYQHGVEVVGRRYVEHDVTSVRYLCTFTLVTIGRNIVDSIIGTAAACLEHLE